MRVLFGFLVVLCLAALAAPALFKAYRCSKAPTLEGWAMCLEKRLTSSTKD